MSLAGKRQRIDHFSTNFEINIATKHYLPKAVLRRHPHRSSGIYVGVHAAPFAFESKATFFSTASNATRESKALLCSITPTCRSASRDEGIDRGHKGKEEGKNLLHHG